MPRPVLPPTPSSSADIKAKDGTQQLSSIHPTFELPPPAIHDASRCSPSDSKLVSSTSQTASHPPALTPSSSQVTYPVQAAETVKSRRRPAASKESGKKKLLFSLPPPPTRSRKIIQMKPRTQQDTAEASLTRDAARPGGQASEAEGRATTTSHKNYSGSLAVDAAQAQGKKKQPSTVNAAGRKIARKTAHSLIERRRRSKMNEEFAVLKNMVPACTGEMHKLAILQASIDYVRYLEDCIAKLKAQHAGDQTGDEVSRNPLPSFQDFHPAVHADPSGDVDMSDSETASPLFTGHTDTLNRAPISPALISENARLRQHSYSSVSTEQWNHSFSNSAGASPAFGPQRYSVYAQSNAAGSSLTSPALNPQSDVDQEASAALLMLNHDRRGTNPSLGPRGLSVRDLLST